MADTWDKIKKLIASGDIRVSEHGYDELAADGITVREAVAGSLNAIVLEDYPHYPKDHAFSPCKRITREIRFT